VDGQAWEPLVVPGISIEAEFGLPKLALGNHTLVVTGADDVISAVGTIEP
jgi:hypothetical protein